MMAVDADLAGEDASRAGVLSRDISMARLTIVQSGYGTWRRAGAHDHVGFALEADVRRATHLTLSRLGRSRHCPKPSQPVSAPHRLGGIELQRLAIVGDGLVPLPQGLVDMTADIERERGPRIALQPALHDFHGLFGIGESLRGSAGPEVGTRSFAVHDSVAGTGVDHLRELGDGVIVIALLRMGSQSPQVCVLMSHGTLVEGLHYLGVV